MKSKIQTIHLIFLVGMPLYLYQQYGYIESKKVAFIVACIVISYLLLSLIEKRKEIAKDWFSAFLASIAGMVVSAIVFGFPLGWVINRL